MNGNTYDYIVIGSGFGGSVSSMRLSEKGYSVLTLEKGREFKDSDFPKTNWNIRKFLWAPLIKCFGFQNIAFFKDVLILSGVGVGGGSLVYANTLMTPPSKFYHNPIWSKFNDWETVLPPFYEKAKKMLGAVENPLTNIEDHKLKEVAQDMGREHEFQNVNVGVYFGDPDKEVDPFFNGEGPLRKGCIECAGCMVGCRHNAKNTLPKNYLYFAKKNGAQIKALRKVVKVEFKEDTYHVTTVKTGALFFKDKQVFKSKGLVVSGGVLGTMDLLLKQKHKTKSLENLSPMLGENVRTNSESLCGVTTKNKDLKLNNGIAISSVFNPDDDTHVEIVKYSDGSSLMKFLSSFAISEGNPYLRVFKLFHEVITSPLRVLKRIFGRSWAKKSIIFLVMQNLDNSMKLGLSRFSFLSFQNTGEEKVPSYIPIGQEVMERYAKKVNGESSNSLVEVLFNASTTAHILGGVKMGDDETNGVVNSRFEVFNYPNMYVLDGSIIPCNLGVNPSLTITALSEYAMSHIQEK